MQVNYEEFNEKWKRKAYALRMTPEQANGVVSMLNDFDKLSEKQQDMMEGFVLAEKLMRMGGELQIEIPEDGSFDGMTPKEIKECKALAKRMGAFDKKQNDLWGYIIELMEQV